MIGFALILYCLASASVGFGFQWKSSYSPQALNPGGSITLHWRYSLTDSEKLKAKDFALVLIEKESQIFSNQWQGLAVKIPFTGFYKPVSQSSGIHLIHSQGAGLVIYNVTSNEAITRYRCTFLSGFSATKQIIMPNIRVNIVRLVNGWTSNQGRVEIFHNGEWGTICHNRWDIRDAHVVCRMLGYHSAYRSLGWAYYGRGSGRIWLDEVECFGNEYSIAQCSHRPWGENNCTHYQDAGVKCLQAVASTSRPYYTTRRPYYTTRRWYTSYPTPGSISTWSPTAYPTSGNIVAVRLVGGNSSSMGRVEVYYNRVWGTICDDGWDIRDAGVVCRMLGYRSALKAVGSAYFGGGTGKIWLDEVNCNGDEISVAYCRHRPWGIHDCFHSEDAGVVCENVITQMDKDVCTFEHGYCGWTNENTTNGFHWRRNRGPTLSHNTGPPGDHTTGVGFYVYIETSSPRKKGDVAKLVSPLVYRNSTCLAFYYYMYGATVNALNVNVGQETLWTMSGDQGRKWYRATVPLNISESQVTIEGVCGSNFQSDIAVDDIQFLNNTVCNKSAESAVPATINYIISTKYVKTGRDVYLPCYAYGKPRPKVKWIRNNKTMASGISNLVLPIKEIKFHQNGVYSCVASNEFGSDKRITLLFVLQRPMNTAAHFNVSHSAAITGETVMVTCKTEAYPTATCELFFNGDKLTDTNHIIPSVTPSDFGLYKCSCNNSQGSDYGIGSLTLYEKPKIQTLFPRSQNISETASIVIFCNASGNPLPNISWWKIGENKRLVGSGKTLSILHSSLDDEGLYTCIADNGRYQATANARVTLKYRVSRIIDPPKNTTVDEDFNRTVALYCNVTGTPKPNVTWYKVGDVNPIKHGTILTLHANWTSSGIYECIAENGIGSAARARAFYQILHKPYSTNLKTDRDNNVVIGNAPIKVICTTIANPPADRYDIYLGSKHITTSTTGLYSIPKAKASDQGTYACFPRNNKGGGSNASMVLHVFGALSIDYYPKNKTVTEGRMVTLYCNASSSLYKTDLPAIIRWRKIGQSELSLPIGKRLLFEDIQPKDAGVYECEARNGIALPDVAKATIIVQHKPYNTTLALSTGGVQILQNATITLVCKATAVPPVNKFRFFHFGKSIGESLNGVFNITRVSAGGNGTYSCVAENSIGEGLHASITLKFSECGTRTFGSSFVQSRIIGGTNAKHGAWPWQVQMAGTRMGITYSHLCGGSIINNLWIVTAAHCVAVRAFGSNYTVVKPDDLNITLGEYNRKKDDGTEQLIPVEKVVVHKDYNASIIDYDIALLKLQWPIKFNEYVFPVCLPSFEFPPNTECYITGWGRTSMASYASSIVLQETTVPLINRTLCKTLFQGIGTITTRMLCNGYNGSPRTTCHGDSGGPLVCARNGRWFLSGITSWGYRNCADMRYPSVYADVFYFRNWIPETIRQNS